jgi:hypothetical protein
MFFWLLVLCTCVSANSLHFTLRQEDHLRNNQSVCDEHYPSECMHVSYLSQERECLVTFGHSHIRFVNVQNVKNAEDCFLVITCTEDSATLHVTPLWKYTFSTSACFARFVYQPKTWWYDEAYHLDFYHRNVDYRFRMKI